MVQRIRRAKEAFEKKTKAFQGPDWPHYEKRVIVGQKKKEDMDPSLFQGDSVAASASPEAVSSSSPSHPASAPESNHANTADQTVSWWTANRETPEPSTTADTKDQPATLAGPTDEGTAS
jgi:hypothetical protein